MYKVVKRDCPVFGIGPYTCEFICDTASDISTLPTSISEGTGGKTAYDNQKCASGSIANVAENGSESKQYMLNNQDIWCPYSVAAGSSGGGSSGSSITVDFALSNTSENPVANKVIVAALDDKANVDDIPNIKVNAAVDADTVNGHSVNADVPENAKFTDTIPDLSPYAKKTDIPTELPANGGNADTVGDLDAYHMGTTTYAGAHYPPEQFPVYCQYNVYNDNRFAFVIDNSFQPNSKYEVRCDYAANSGNADTLGKKSISDFIYAHGYYTGNVDDIQYPYSGIIINATGTPPQASVWGTMLCYGGGTGSYAQVWVTNDDNATMFVRHFNGNRWTEWSEIYASGNKPYITGSATVAANSQICVTNHGFIPSAVIWWESAGLSGIAVSFNETQFNTNIISTDARTVNYLIFK